jgi:hypothetical protein
MFITRQNHYHGVNAHFVSHVQAHGEWDSFHATYIVKLAEFVEKNLPSGYYVAVERSLQLREYGNDGYPITSRPKPDSTIFAREAIKELTAVPASAPLMLALDDTFDDPQLYYPAFAIYQQNSQRQQDTPIVRFELLSPSNKHGEGLFAYRQKRLSALKSEIQLVEIDFLHFYTSPLARIPAYPNEPNASPYNISISSPVPSFAEGKAYVHRFFVDEAIPKLEIPLANQHTTWVDFDTPYHELFKTFYDLSRRVDYVQTPSDMATYTPRDQHAIRAVMQRVQRAHADGMNLDQTRLLSLPE